MAENTHAAKERDLKGDSSAGMTSADAQAQKELLRRFRAKISPHLGTLVRQSEAVAKQFIPSPLELEPFGTETPFEEGKNNRGIYGLERIYEDRAVLTPYFDCAAYCRYCFKKTRTLAGEGKRMTDENIEAAMRYLADDPKIKTVLITGGDPFQDQELLFRVLDQVVKIPHIRNIRCGTRNILFKPHAITEEFAEKLASYNQVNYTSLRNSKNISIGFSLNHADEVSPDVARAAQRLIRKGLVIRGQIVLLKGINDNVKSIGDLLEIFAGIGIVPYYLFHCLPVVGTKHMRTSVQKGLDILRELSHFSGSSSPLYVYVTPIGKHRLGLNERLQYVTIDGQRYIRAETPYKAADFLHYADKKCLPQHHEANANGYVISHYLDGDDEGGLS